MPLTEPSRFKIQARDGTFKNSGDHGFGRNGKAWSQGTVKSHLRMSIEEPWRSNHFVVDMDEETINSEVVEYQMIEVNRTPMREFLRQMHLEKEKKEKRKTPRSLVIHHDDGTIETLVE